MLFLLFIPVFVVPLLLVVPFLIKFGLLPSVSGIVRTIYQTSETTFHYLTDGEILYGESYSVLRHSRPLVLYQGTKTSVQISVFGERPLPHWRRVFLQQRGFRTGLLGWKLGGYLGGSKLPGIEVTPIIEESWSSLSVSQQMQIDDDISRLFSPPNSKHELLECLFVHIPVRSGDGYFRLRITSEKPGERLAESAPFRVGSLTWSSAHPQGATLVGILPELLAKSGFVAARTAAWTTFYTSFPILKVAEYMPGPWGQQAMRLAYNLVGGEDLNDKYMLNEHIQKSKDRFYQLVPFGAAGVRTVADLAVDEERGRAGVWFRRGSRSTA